MKKIIKNGLCVLMACGCVYVNAAEKLKPMLSSSSRQLTPEEPTEMIQALLPDAVADYDKIRCNVRSAFQMCINHPDEKLARGTVECPSLYKLIMMIRNDRVPGSIYTQLTTEIQKPLQQMSHCRENQMCSWGKLSARTYGDLKDLFFSLQRMAYAAFFLSCGVNTQLENVELENVDQCWAFFEVASILESNGTTVKTTFFDSYESWRKLPICFYLTPNAALEWENGGKNDYIRRIAALNFACEAGLTTEVFIYIDEGLSEVLSKYLKLRGNTELDKDPNVRKYINFFGREDKLPDVSRILFTAIESGMPADVLILTNLQLRVDKSFSDFLIDHKVTTIELKNVNVDRAEGDDAGDLSNTSIESFSQTNIKSVDEVVSLVKCLPETIRDVYLACNNTVTSEGTQEMFKCALKHCPNMQQLWVTDTQTELTLETIIYAVLRSSLVDAHLNEDRLLFLKPTSTKEGIFTEEYLKELIKKAYIDQELGARHEPLSDLARDFRIFCIEQKAGALVHMLMAIRTCSPRLKDPYKLVDFLKTLLTSAEKLSDEAVSIDGGNLTSVSSEFRDEVEAACSKGLIKTDEDFKRIYQKTYETFEKKLTKRNKDRQQKNND